MNIQEYRKVQKMDYPQYCDYLKEKYGQPEHDYMTPNFNKNDNISRTKEGLVIHHICENKAIMLSEKKFAEKNPYEYQLAKNLVYCDYLEHLFLHVLICEHYAYFRDRDHKYEVPGIGGICNFLVPELNDVYSGFIAKEEWKHNCHKKIINDKLVYLHLIKRFLKNCTIYPGYRFEFYKKSFNAKHNSWDEKKNYALYEEIKYFYYDHRFKTYDFRHKAYHKSYGYQESIEFEILDKYLKEEQ